MVDRMGNWASFWCKDDVMTGTGSHVFLEWETADQVEKGIAGSYNRKSRDLEGETADQYEKRIVGSYNRKSRDLEGETADEFEKRIVGSRESKTTEKTRAQSPKSNFSNGGSPLEWKQPKINKYFFYCLQ